MATFKVSTPVEGFTGEVGGVHFAAGHAEVDDEQNAAALSYFRAAGYHVEQTNEPEPEPEVAPRRTRRNSTKQEDDQ